MRVHFTILLAAAFSAVVDASRGDQSVAFRTCVAEQTAKLCGSDGISLKADQTLPLYLRLFGWTCASNVDYLCQRSITKESERRGIQIEQYHGKWPFIRLLGIQEPASVAFSVLNGLAHYRGLQLVRKHVTVQNPMQLYYIIFAYVGMNAWLWSSIFHIRDFPSTEKLDYFSAGTYVLYGLFYSPIRVFRLYESKNYGLIVKMWSALCFIALSAHIGYLTFVIFDYGYNMLANVVVGALHGLLWIVYSFKYYKGRPTWVWWPALTVLVLAGAMSLELLDFPPWLYTVDAHSLWHLATVPITVVWYKFLIQDAKREQSVISRKDKRVS